MSTNTLTHHTQPTTQEHPTTPRPRGLIWLTLRQNSWLIRTLAIGVILVAAALVWIHLVCSDAASALQRVECENPKLWNEARCWELVLSTRWPHFWFIEVLQPAVAAVPLLIGVFVGAPLLAQEHERGTIRLIRAQTVSPARWLAARLAVPALAVLAATGVLAALMSWVWRADIAHGLAFDSPFRSVAYPALGIAPIAWSLFALALGVLVGQVVRRTLPAMFATGALIATTHGLIRWARPSFHPAVDEVVALNTPYPTNAWWLDGGVVMPDGTRFSSDACMASREASFHCEGATASWLRYHPVDHFLPIQLVEAGILLALTALALVAVFRRIRV